MGSEFVDVLMAMVAWGDRWTAGDAGPPVLYRHRACGQITHAEPHCAACGEILHSGDVDVEPGPGLADRGLTGRGGRRAAALLDVAGRRAPRALRLAAGCSG